MPRFDDEYLPVARELVEAELRDALQFMKDDLASLKHASRREAETTTEVE